MRRFVRMVLYAVPVLILLLLPEDLYILVVYTEDTLWLRYYIYVQYTISLSLSDVLHFIKNEQ